MQPCNQYQCNYLIIVVSYNILYMNASVHFWLSLFVSLLSVLHDMSLYKMLEELPNTCSKLLQYAFWDSVGFQHHRLSNWVDLGLQSIFFNITSFLAPKSFFFLLYLHRKHKEGIGCDKDCKCGRYSLEMTTPDYWSWI